MDYLLSQTEDDRPLSGPGLELTREKIFYQYMVFANSGSKNSVKATNYWIDEILPSQICGETKIKDVEYVISNLTVDFPKTSKTGTSERYTPKMARDLGLSYVANVHVDVYNKKTKVKKRVLFCELPNMVESNRCYLSVKPDEFDSIEDWKMYCGEDPYVGSGYYIINGAEKIINMREGLRTSQIFTLNTIKKKPRLESRVTIVHKSETSIVRIQFGEGINSIDVFLPHNAAKEYPLYLIIRLLWKMYNEFNEKRNTQPFSILDFENLICSFASPKEVDAIRILLLPTKHAFNTLFRKKNMIDDNAIKEFLKKDNIKNTGSLESTYTAIHDDLFRSASSFEKKMSTLAFMICQHCRTFLKYRHHDTRDFWGNKMLTGAAAAMEKLLATLNRDATSNDSFTPDKMDSVISKTMIKSFNSCNWGSFRKDLKENLTDARKVQSVQSVASQLDKTTTPINNRTKQYKIRSVRRSQHPFVCPINATEGTTCGLTKHKAMLTWISLDQSFQKYRNDTFKRLLHEESIYTNNKGTTIFKYQLEINGKLLEKLYISDLCLEKFKSFLDKSKLEHTMEIVDEIIKYTDKGDQKKVEIKHWKGKDFTIKNITHTCANILHTLFGIQSSFVSINKNKKYCYFMTINGIVTVSKDRKSFLGTVLWVTKEFVDQLRYEKRTGGLPRDSCIKLNESDYCIEYYDDRGRLLVPYLTVNPITGNLIADEKDLWSKIEPKMYHKAEEFIEMFYKEQAIELIDAKEHESIFQPFSFDEFRKIGRLRSILNEIEGEPEEINIRECKFYIALIRKSIPELGLNFDRDELLVKIPLLADRSIMIMVKKYVNEVCRFTHCAIDQNMQFSSATNLVPALNMMQSPRAVYGSSMESQSITQFLTLDYSRFDTSYKKSRAPRRRYFETVASEPLSKSSRPSTENIIVLVRPDPENYEDPAVMSEDFARSLNLCYSKYFSFKTIQGTNDFLRKMKDDHQYRLLDDKGIARLGSVFFPGDVIIGKCRIDPDTKREIDTSIRADPSQYGIIERILICTGEKDNQNIIRVMCYSPRFLIEGDKISSGFAQKVTVSRIVPTSQLARIVGGPQHGTYPHIQINPCAFPSRMTMNKLVEGNNSKACTFIRKRSDASTFNDYLEEFFMDVLSKNKMDKFGDEFYSTSDGEMIMDPTKNEYFKGFTMLCSYQLLPHNTLDKIQARNTGRYSRVNRQAIPGKSRSGGLRFGEMERDTLLGHGSAHQLVDRLGRCSDAYTVTVCTNCKNISADSHTNVPVCSICDTKDSLVLVPITFIFKYFTNIMATMGVGINLETENI